MNQQKPILEQIRPGFGSSFTVRQFEKQFHSSDPIWHFHPEYEIVYISDGRGKRHIGDHQSYYANGDLIMIGPNLPHFGFTHGTEEQHIEIVVQLKPEFLGKDFFRVPEGQNINTLFENAQSGISFQGSTKRQVGELLIQLQHKQGFKKLIGLLEIFDILSTSSEYHLLHANGPAIQVSRQDQMRIEQVYVHVQKHFAQKIKLQDVASMVNMTIPSFCRYFKKITNMTFTQFVNEYRIALACRLLMQTDDTISNIADACGINNLSHFNKQFRLITGQAPSAYRTQFKSLVVGTN